MVVFDPLRVVITNYENVGDRSEKLEDGGTDSNWNEELVQSENNPEDESAGTP